MRSPESGVLKAYHAKLQDNVAVGAPLFTIDTDGKASSSGASSSSSNPASSSPPSPTPSTPTPAAAIPVPVVTAHIAHAAAAHRRPSIHFTHGARATIDAELGQSSSTSNANSITGSSSSSSSSGGSGTNAGNYLAQLESLFPSKIGAKNEFSVPPHFGRPRISDDEGFWITSGGAFGAPPPAPKVDKGGKKK